MGGLYPGEIVLGAFFLGGVFRGAIVLEAFFIGSDSPGAIFRAAIVWIPRGNEKIKSQILIPGNVTIP